MVKPPKIRHSKSHKEPLTIELGPDEVSRIEEPKTDAAAESVEPGADAVSAAETGTMRPAEDESNPETAAGAELSPADQVSGAEAEANLGEEAKAEAVETVDATTTADKVANSTTTAGKAAEDETINFMGSEWPPEPATQSTENPPEEERVRHAFGRDPGTPPPFSRNESPERESSIRPVKTPERKGLGMPVIAAGILGGVIALVGAGGLQFAGLLPSPGTSVTAPADNGEAVAALKAEIAALKQEIEAVKANTGGGDSAGLSQTVTELEGGVRGLTTALDQAKADIAALKDAVAQGTAGDGAAVQALNQKLAELETSIATLKDTVAQGSAGDGAAVQAINQKIAELQASVTALQQTGVSQQAIDAINQKLAAVEAAAASASDAAKAGEARLGALEQSVATLSEQVASQAGQPKVALAIAGAALKSAIERGGTFTAEVETFAAIAPNSPELPALRDIAARGVASRSELAEGMNDAANAMVAASETPPEDADFWDSLLESAESLIKVRPIGEVEGDTVPSKVARMEVAVKAGDFTKALAEYDSLPEPSKVAGKAYADRIRDRVTAEELVAKALAGALNPA